MSNLLNVSSPSSPNISITGEATGQIDLGPDHCPIEVIGNESIRGSFGDSCIYQAMAAARSPGVSRFVLNPDAHWGYGVPIGSVLVSPTHIYPSPVGVDIKCSMSLLQTDVPEDEIVDPPAVLCRHRLVRIKAARNLRPTAALAIDARDLAGHLTRPSIDVESADTPCAGLSGQNLLPG